MCENIPTWDPASLSDHAVLENEDTQARLYDDSGPVGAVRSYICKSEGKHYLEITSGGYNDKSEIKLSIGTADYITTGVPSAPEDSQYVWGYDGANGNKFHDGISTSYGDPYGALQDPVIGIAIDLDNSKIFFALNGVWQDDGDPVSGINPAFTIPSNTTFYVIATGVQFSTFGVDRAVIYTEEENFTYTLPSGYSPLFKNDKTFIDQELPAVTGSLHGFTSAYLNKELPGIEGSILEEARVLGDIPAITGTIRTSARIAGSLKGITGGIFCSARIAGNLHWLDGFISALNNRITIGTDPDDTSFPVVSLPAVTGEIRSASKILGELPAISGGMSASAKLVNELPAIIGQLTGRQTIKADLAGRLSEIIGGLTGWSDLRGDIAGSLSAILGEIISKQGSIGSIDREIPAVRGAIEGTTGAVGRLTGEFYITGELRGHRINTGNIYGEFGITGNIHALGGIVGNLSGNIYVTGNLYSRQEVLEKLYLTYERRTCG